MFNKSSEEILISGLEAMRIACQALTSENKELKNQILGLKKKIDILQDKVLSNGNDEET